MDEQCGHKPHAESGCSVPDEPDDDYASAYEELRKGYYKISGVPDEDDGDKREEDAFTVAFVLSAGHHHDEDQLQHRPHEMADKLH